MFNVRFSLLRQFSTDRTISEYAKAMLRRLGFSEFMLYFSYINMLFPLTEWHR